MVYNLYLDESTTSNNQNKRFHSISGIIVEKEYHDTILKNDLDNLKQNLFGNSSMILHEKDIKTMMKKKKNSVASDYKLSDEYNFFGTKSNVKIFFTKFEQLISKADIYIMGASIDEDSLKNRFPLEIQNDKTSIMLQIILENFCHFLKNKNATGNIFYESIGEKENKDMCLRFHHIKSIGTMYINPYAFQKLIHGIYFPQKKENITGLQLADFIPNNVARFHAKMKKLEYNLYKVINKHKYDGGVKEKDRYGIKLLP